MNREDVIKLMLQVEPEMVIRIKDHEEGLEGFTGEDPKLLNFWPFKNYVTFADLVAAAEREACAKLAEETVCDTHLPTGYKIHGTRVAKAIRERSNP